MLLARKAPDLLNLALCNAVNPSEPFTTAAELQPEVVNASAASELLRTTFLTTSRRVCCYVFKVGDLAFNCVQCQAHTTCVLCEQCFRGSNHDGHDVTFFRVSTVGGCCDCGDTTAWKPEGFCADHGKPLALHDLFKDARWVGQPSEEKVAARAAGVVLPGAVAVTALAPRLCRDAATAEARLSNFWWQYARFR